MKKITQERILNALSKVEGYHHKKPEVCIMKAWISFGLRIFSNLENPLTDESIVVGYSQEDGSVSLGVRLWYKDILNIESRPSKIAKVYNQKEALAVLTGLHECLCQVNELVARLREREDEN